MHKNGYNFIVTSFIILEHYFTSRSLASFLLCFKSHDALLIALKF